MKIEVTRYICTISVPKRKIFKIYPLEDGCVWKQSLHLKNLSQISIHCEFSLGAPELPSSSFLDWGRLDRNKCQITMLHVCIHSWGWWTTIPMVENIAWIQSQFLYEVCHNIQTYLASTSSPRVPSHALVYFFHPPYLFSNFSISNPILPFHLITFI